MKRLKKPLVCGFGAEHGDETHLIFNSKDVRYVDGVRCCASCYPEAVRAAAEKQGAIFAERARKKAARKEAERIAPAIKAALSSKSDKIRLSDLPAHMQVRVIEQHKASGGQKVMLADATGTIVREVLME